MRPNRILTATVLLVAACSTRTTTAPSTTSLADDQGQQVQIVRNHFKGWKVGASTVNEQVWIKETAGAAEWKATLRVVDYILNPATKLHQGEHGNRDHPLHYVAYSIEPIRPTPEFRFQNQFTKPGIAIWRFADNRPSWLLVPAMKRHDQNPASPPKADHLLCYAVQPAEPFNAPVSVIDQFTKNPAPSINGLRPSHLCVPVFKRKDGSDNTEGVEHPNDYLAIYNYWLNPPESYNGTVWTTDQFRAAQPLTVMYSELLAVPSTRNDG